MLIKTQKSINVSIINDCGLRVNYYARTNYFWLSDCSIDCETVFLHNYWSGFLENCGYKIDFPVNSGCTIGGHAERGSCIDGHSTSEVIDSDANLIDNRSDYLNNTGVENTHMSDMNSVMSGQNRCELQKCTR